MSYKKLSRGKLTVIAPSLQCIFSGPLCIRAEVLSAQAFLLTKTIAELFLPSFS